MKKGQIFTLAVILLCILGFIYSIQKSPSQENVQPDDNEMSEGLPIQEDIEEPLVVVETEEEEQVFRHRGELVDVLSDESVSKRRGLVTDGLASGTAFFDFVDNTFTLYVEFSNIPTPNGQDFYEGWLVKSSPFDFINTGELTVEDGEYVNSFASSTDYRDYDFYVLTIEPNDGDPAPAGHVLEGTLVEVVE